MCTTCKCNVSAIPGPAEVAGGLIGAGVGAAISKPGRRVLFWGVCVPALPFAIWGELHWWTLVLVALVAAVACGTLAVTRILHRSVIVAPLTPAERVAELERRRRNAIPVPRAAQPALPRAMRRQVPRWRVTATVTGVRRSRPAQALPAPEKVITPSRVITPQTPQ